MSETQSTYNYKVVRQFSIMAVVWGIVGMLVGVIIAAQLVWPELNFAPFLTYGRLRPLHTNAVIFAFGGCALMGTSYYVVQRTCHTRLFAGGLAAFTFWGWQLVILLAALSLPMAFSLHNTDGRPWYREPWPWILMTGPAIVVVAGFTTAFLAVKSNDGLVEDDYYKQGLEINQTLDRDHMRKWCSESGEHGGKMAVYGQVSGRSGPSFPLFVVLDSGPKRVCHQRLF